LLPPLGGGLKGENIMGDIYVVQGTASCGKTSTIKEIFRILDTKYPNCIKEVYLFKDARKLWLNNQHQAMLKLIFRDRKDIKIEMQNVKGLLVGIESQGDPPYNRLEKSLDLFSNNGCDIIFCAERNIPINNGIVANWVKSHPKYKIKGSITLQRIGNKQQRTQSNLAQAQSIVQQAGL